MKIEGGHLKSKIQYKCTNVCVQVEISGRNEDALRLSLLSSELPAPLKKKGIKKIN